MVKQIVIDDNNIVQLCSIGGLLEGGIDVNEIPNEVMACPVKWKFESGCFAPNDAYVEPTEDEAELTLDDLALAVAELAETSAADKLEVEMAIAELAEVITNG